MEEGQSGDETGRDPSDKLPASPAAIPPLVVDTDDSMEVDSENEAGDNIEQDIERFRTERANAARTLYHQRRADDDTM
jgi:hypothetical protein